MTQSWQAPPPPMNTPGSAPSSESEAGLKDQAQEKVGQLADQAQQTAGQVTEQAKQQATSQLESQKGRAVDSLVTVAQALRQTGQHLREQDQGMVSEYVEKVAERVEGLTNHLRSSDVPQLLDETQEFARRRPAVFLGAALALGFVGARFLMSSGRRAAAQRGPNQARVSPSPYLQPAGGYGGPRFAPRGSAYDTFEPVADPLTRPNPSGVAGSSTTPGL